MENTELESRLNQLYGNYMGLQALIHSMILTSDYRQRQKLLDHFKTESESVRADMWNESRQADEALHAMENFCNTTIAWLEDVRDLPL
ncbi:hypothetical protein [Chromobacterium violaceum]|uniref:Uncharacterized protein n=1 Tax=Chromobacterium violaceum TaxID=536 RepID=A0A202B291_CHRVL|nr:hypothetical protein [Chromobacterium violaceum]OVE45603.1 hypothetical protein CBW21_22455 [Chromobacterium violaceum]